MATHEGRRISSFAIECIILSVKEFIKSENCASTKTLQAPLVEG